jgi:hypothetical protein
MGLIPSRLLKSGVIANYWPRGEGVLRERPFVRRDEPVILPEEAHMRIEKPKKKSGRPEFVNARIAELQRQLALETNENRKGELQAEINDWQRIRPKPSRDRWR